MLTTSAHRQISSSRSNPRTSLEFKTKVLLGCGRNSDLPAVFGHLEGRSVSSAYDFIRASQSYWEGWGVILGSVSFAVISALVLDCVHFASLLARDRWLICMFFRTCFLKLFCQGYSVWIMLHAQFFSCLRYRIFFSLIFKRDTLFYWREILYFRSSKDTLYYVNSTCCVQCFWLFGGREFICLVGGLCITVYRMYMITVCRKQTKIIFRNLNGSFLV